MIKVDEIEERASDRRELKSLGKKVASSTKERFDNIIKQIVVSAALENSVSETAQYFIRLITEYLNYKEAICSMENMESTSHNTDVLYIYQELEKKIFPEKEGKYTQVKITLDVNDAPILLNPWKGNRIIDNLFSINVENPFDGYKYDYNIHNTYISPINMAICCGGNHSQLAARYKNIGKTIIDMTYDISDLYDVIEYDGIGFKRIDDSEYLVLKYSEEQLFYSGVLFELGRVNWEYLQ